MSVCWLIMIHSNTVWPWSRLLRRILIWLELPDMGTSYFCPSWYWWFVGIGDLSDLRRLPNLYIETCSRFARKAKSLEFKYFSETWRQEPAAAFQNICSSSQIFIKMKRFSRDTLCVRSILSHKALTWKKKKQILHSNTFIVFFDIDSSWTSGSDWLGKVLSASQLCLQDWRSSQLDSTAVLFCYLYFYLYEYLYLYL